MGFSPNFLAHVYCYGGRPRPRPHCVRWEPSSPIRGTAAPPPFSSSVYCGQMAGQDATRYGGRPQRRLHCVRWHVQIAKRFEPSTVLWAFHTMQPSSSTCGYTCQRQVKLCDPSLTRAIPEHLRGELQTIKRYTNRHFTADLPSVSFSKEAGGSRNTVGVTRQRMTDGATNRCDANVGRRRSSISNSRVMYGQHPYRTLCRCSLLSTSSHSDDLMG